MGRIGSTYALAAVLLLGCGSDDGTGGTEASVNALCREWCTCSGNANPSCLSSCESELFGEHLCIREEEKRYRACMIDRGCEDPFDDCKADSADPSYQQCSEEINTKCEAQCPVREPCEGWPDVDCVSACRAGVTCERVNTCAEAGCRDSRCWVTGVCEAP